MDTHQPQKTETRVAEKNHGEENQPSPPSASSSPSHEFSFTISLHSSSTAASSDKAKAAAPSFAIDLSPADDIFFHGHLLPLHLLSHLPVSPRSSTNSLDSFTLPIGDLTPEKNAGEEACSSSSTAKNSNGEGQHRRRTKSRPFSMFRLTKWRRESEPAPAPDEKETHERKLKFDVSNVLKRYARMVRPLLSFAGKKNNLRLRRPSFSFSGNLNLKSTPDLKDRRRREFSAPASTRTSPSNSGLLVATAPHSSSTSDSTMEELQGAIQASVNAQHLKPHFSQIIVKRDRVHLPAS